MSSPSLRTQDWRDGRLSTEGAVEATSSSLQILFLAKLCWALSLRLGALRNTIQDLVQNVVVLLGSSLFLTHCSSPSQLAGAHAAVHHQVDGSLPQPARRPVRATERHRATPRFWSFHVTPRVTIVPVFHWPFFEAFKEKTPHSRHFQSGSWCGADVDLLGWLLIDQPSLVLLLRPVLWRKTLRTAFHGWTRICRPGTVQTVIQEAGIASETANEKEGHLANHPEQFRHCRLFNAFVLFEASWSSLSY